MNTQETVEYIRSRYFVDGRPVDKDAEALYHEASEAKDAVLDASRDYHRKKDILVEVAYAREMIAMYRILNRDAGWWDSFIAELRANRVTSRDLQQIQSTVNAAYKEKLAQARVDFLSDTTTVVYTGIKSFVAEYHRDGITLKVVYLHPVEEGNE